MQNNLKIEFSYKDNIKKGDLTIVFIPTVAYLTRRPDKKRQWITVKSINFVWLFFELEFEWVEINS